MRRKHLPLAWRGLLLAGLILLPALSACFPNTPDGAPTPAGAQPSPTGQAPTQPAPTLQPQPSASPTPPRRIAVDAGQLTGVTIRFWHPWSGATADTLNALVDEFNRANKYQIRVEATAQPGGWDDLENRLTGALETGEPPDLAAGFLHQAQTWDAQQEVVDLEPYLTDPQWGLGPDAPEDYYPGVWALGAEADGRRPALALLPGASLLIYNVSRAQELGYRTPPVSVQQFADQACAAADAVRGDADPANDGAGGLLASPDYSAALNWIDAFGGEVAAPEAGGAADSPYTFNTAAAGDAFAYLRDLYDEGCAWATDQPYTEEEFARSAALFATGSLTDLPHWVQAIGRSGGVRNWAVIPYPSPDDIKSLRLSGPMLIAFRSTPERELAAWLLIEWLTQPANHARLVQASAAFPLRRSEVALLDEYRAGLPQWSMALDLLPAARPEPPFASWGQVRWALADAFTQLFRGYFEAKNIPAMLKYLDSMAAELHTGQPPRDLFTPEASPSAAP